MTVSAKSPTSIVIWLGATASETSRTSACTFPVTVASNLSYLTKISTRFPALIPRSNPSALTSTTDVFPLSYRVPLRMSQVCCASIRVRPSTKVEYRSNSHVNYVWSNTNSNQARWRRSYVDFRKTVKSPYCAIRVALPAVSDDAATRPWSETLQWYRQ